jgi:pimeloyl-ACP methyl ester carboxylesterase
MERIYCISGLGGNQRLFDKLHVAGYEFVPVPWVPFEKDDTLASYAQNLFKTIPEANPIILGLSFGGMLTVEIAAHHPVSKAIIVSSAKSKAELTLAGGGLARWIINRGLVPAGCFTIPNPVALNYLGAKSSSDKKMLRDVIRNSDGLFMKRALKSIMNWGRSPGPANVTHIHGTADRVIASATVHSDYWIKGGTHFMIYDRADEVSKIISACLAG